ncbi:hypothetical protein F5B22DRAFT_640436 [Xylaria bambusicola]|uniref:uncharacterized protein n=1 Tax=Xylaria bambusicola TaxID=326684 RepID=UPI002007288B|nr:uncharacterized protein F5B22DRAFT_640436 [Xylaria bambusicola]KAI0503051.1 hypothetical protein F5B22DRAFT_640436 [Xylaria bambusicola]
MTTQEKMPEHYTGSTPTLRGQEWVFVTPQYHDPPENIDRYTDRALPLLPIFAGPRPLSASSSIYEPESDHTNRQMPAPLEVSRNRGDGHRSTSFAGAVDESAQAMVQPPQITIPTYSHVDKSHPQVVSPQPQRPDSRLISLWTRGDELVSPIDTPGPSNWKTHVVSPLSDDFEKGTTSGAVAPANYESWFDDTSSDEEEQPTPQTPAREEHRIADIGFSVPLENQSSSANFRYSDPGSPLTQLSPLSPSFDLEGFCDLIPDAGRSQYFQSAPGRRTVQPQSTHSGGEQTRHPEDKAVVEEPRVSFAVPKLDSFSSDRPGAGQRPVPPPLQLGGRLVQGEFVKTPFPPRPNSATSEKRASSLDEPSARQQKLGRFGSLRRPPRQNSPKPPPGYTEILSQLDKQGVVSPSPRPKGILSKAKQGLKMGSEESRREKRRDELKRQVRHITD